jgi:hypothetical protein
MATLYLDRKGAALDIDAGTLTVRLGGELATRIPLVPLERVVLRGDAVRSTRVLASCGATASASLPRWSMSSIVEKAGEG